MYNVQKFSLCSKNCVYFDTLLINYLQLYLHIYIFKILMKQRYR